MAILMGIQLGICIISYSGHTIWTDRWIRGLHLCLAKWAGPWGWPVTAPRGTGQWSPVRGAAEWAESLAHVTTYVTAGGHSFCTETELFERSSNRTRERVDGGAVKFRFIAIRIYCQKASIPKALIDAANPAHFSAKRAIYISISSVPHPTSLPIRSRPSHFFVLSCVGSGDSRALTSCPLDPSPGQTALTAATPDYGAFQTQRTRAAPLLTHPHPSISFPGQPGHSAVRNQQAIDCSHSFRSIHGAVSARRAASVLIHPTIETRP